MTGRFAPTPSGRMHIGNAYAMLGAWLDARSRGERMLLRIEDIDAPRVLPDADRWIMDDLAWLGLDWDGEPTYQSARIDRYREALRLLAEMRDAQDGDVGEAKERGLESAVYPCFCSRADIRAASAPQEGDGFQIYPGTCRRLAVEQPEIVRARLADGDQHSLRLAMPEADMPLADHPQSHVGDNPRQQRRQQFAPPLSIERAASASGSAACDSPTLTSAEQSGWQSARAGGLRSNVSGTYGVEDFRQRKPQIFVPAGGGCREAGRGGSVGFDDRVFGWQAFDLARDIGDSVLRRADGLFAYQFVVTVDDLDQGVDSIVRGRDLLRSTALQLYIRRLLLRSGFVPAVEADSAPVVEVEASPMRAKCGNPSFAHLPLIDNAAGRRLAKRERSLDMGALRARGVTAEQVIGLCAWLLRLRAEPSPCEARELLNDFSWEALRANHDDRRLDPADPAMPQWLVEAL